MYRLYLSWPFLKVSIFPFVVFFFFLFFLCLLCASFDGDAQK